MDPMQAEERPPKIRKLNILDPGHNKHSNNVPGPELQDSSAPILTQPPILPTKAEGVSSHTAQSENTANHVPNGDEEDDIHADDDLPGNPFEEEQAQDTSSTPLLSKNAMKKLKKREAWEASRDQRKTIRKEKEKAKRVRKREERKANRAAGLAATPGEVAWGRAPPAEGSSAQEKKGGVVQQPRRRAVQLPVTVIIDCSWDDYMVEKEIVSMTNQLTRCYSDNYKANFRAHLAISSFGARLKDRFDNVLNGQYSGWKGVRFLTEDVASAAAQASHWTDPNANARAGVLTGQFAKYTGQETALRQEPPEIVYLSSDSEETLTELKPHGVYIIGGLIDKNRYKGASYKKAQELGIKTAKLPIGDYMKMATRSVLTINHVYEIMLNWLETGDWARAFDAVIPKRKGGVLKTVASEDIEREEGDDGEEGEDMEADEANAGAVELPTEADHEPGVANEEEKPSGPSPVTEQAATAD